MKKLLSVILALMVFASAASACTSEKKSSAEKKTPDYTKKEVNAYPHKSDKPMVFNCLFREDLPEVPFTDAEDFLNQLFTKNVSFNKGENGTYTFKNGDYTLTMDAKKDTISCDSIERFVLVNHKIYYKDEEAEYIKTIGSSTEDEVKPFSVDLGKYDIDIAEYDGRVYLPYCTLSDLFADMGCTVLYKNGELFFRSGVDILSAGGGKGKLGETRSKEMADFSYRELCMTMDNLYGLPSLSALSDSIREKGFDKTLSTYNNVAKRVRELLLSEDNKEYCQGVRLLNYYMYDGGHTQMDCGLQDAAEKFGVLNVASVAEELLDESEPERAVIMENLGKMSDKNELKSELVAKKKAAYGKLELIASEEGAALYRSGDTYYFDFNAFENTAVKPFKEALDYAKSHNAKKFVIDLSTKGGGSDYVVNYMLAMILGEDTHYYKSSVSDSTFKTNVLVDKNLDGKFDKKDEAVSYDFKFAIITSQYSYSNANCMPCAAQDGGVTILGEPSGGGCCMVTARYYPNGCLYSTSGSSYNIHPDGKDVDSGTVPDTVLPGAKDSYKGFYDFDAINKGIDAFYKK